MRWLWLPQHLREGLFVKPPVAATLRQYAAGDELEVRVTADAVSYHHNGASTCPHRRRLFRWWPTQLWHAGARGGGAAATLSGAGSRRTRARTSGSASTTRVQLRPVPVLRSLRVADDGSGGSSSSSSSSSSNAEPPLIASDAVASAPRTQYERGQRLRVLLKGEWRWCRVVESPAADAALRAHAASRDGGAGAGTSTGTSKTATTTTSDVKLDLHALNHAIALLEPDEYEAEMQRLKVQLTDKRSHIHDIFSDEQLDTRTQLTLLKFREAGRHKELLKGPEVDVDTEEYQQARKASQFKAEQKTQRTGWG